LDISDLHNCNYNITTDVLIALYKKLSNQAKTRLVFSGLKGLNGFYDQLAVECTIYATQKKL